MRKDSSGFTITELLIAVGLAAIIISSATMLVYSFIRQGTRFQEYSDALSESQFLKEDINRSLRNSVRLDPKEDLVSMGDEAYHGIVDLPTAAVPTDCDPSQSVVRFTSFEYNKESARTKRLWNEQTSVDQSGTPHELRVSLTDENSGLFNKTSGPEEVLMVDADLRNVRRYKVRNFRLHKASVKDPLDDATKTVNGVTKTFDYVSVFLDRPTRADNTSQISKADVSFVVGSELFAAKTYIICRDKSDGSLIQLEPPQNTKTVLLNSAVGKYKLTNFAVLFAGTKDGQTVDEADFSPNAYGTSLLQCINTVKLVITLDPENGEETIGGLKTRSDSVRAARFLFLTNHQTKRASSCF